MRIHALCGAALLLAAPLLAASPAGDTPIIQFTEPTVAEAWESAALPTPSAVEGAWLRARDEGPGRYALAVESSGGPIILSFESRPIWTSTELYAHEAAAPRSAQDFKPHSEVISDGRSIAAGIQGGWGRPGLKCRLAGVGPDSLLLCKRLREDGKPEGDVQVYFRVKLSQLAAVQFQEKARQARIAVYDACIWNTGVGSAWSADADAGCASMPRD